MSKLAGMLTRLFKAPPRDAEAPAMLEAMRQARETLPVFWDWLDANQETAANRALKVGFDTRRGSTEYMWLTDVRSTALLVSGLVSDQPWDVPELKVGDIYPIDVDKIADWTFQQDGLFYGHFTTRVLAAFDPSMALAKMAISDNPLPSPSVLH